MLSLAAGPVPYQEARKARARERVSLEASEPGSPVSVPSLSSGSYVEFLLVLPFMMEYDPEG